MKTAITKFTLAAGSHTILARTIVEIVGETPNLYLIKHKGKVSHHAKNNFILNSIAEKREGVMLREITGTAFKITFVPMGAKVEIICEIPDGRFLINYQDKEALIPSDWIEEIKPDYAAFSKQFLWGTRGKDGKEELKWVRLIDCSTEHLKAILNTQAHISVEYRETIQFILKERE
jgi:hypothetical protein